ncbi:MAG: hypothetical protein U5K71_08355 [Gracilimonas sp.]|nr:hypothetical protein [Gracilimonas sp.]
MSKYIFLASLSLSLLIISCSSSEIKQNENKPKTLTQNEALELVDIRIYENGDIKINGSSLSESSLVSHIDALEIDQESKVRISSSDMVYTGLVNKITRVLVLKNVEQVDINMMSPEAFKQFENDLIIDILSNGKILVDGTLLYPADLSVALKNSSDLTNDTDVRLIVNDMASMGTVTDIQKTLINNRVTNITHPTDRS